MFFNDWVLCSLRLSKLKREGQKNTEQKTSPQSNTTQIKILTYPGLA